MTESIGPNKPLYEQLTYEVIVPTSKKRLLITLVGTILVTLFVNYLAGLYLKAYPTNRGYWLVNEKWTMLQMLEAPVDWLILGDSSANQGVVPGVLTGDSAESAINLSTVASLTAVNDAWMLQTYIDRFGPPEKVLIVHTYDVWHRNVLPIMLAKTPISWGAWNQMNPPLELSLIQTKNIFLGRFLPIYADNQALMQIIYNGVFGPQQLLQMRFSRQPDGYMPLPNPEPKRVEADAEVHIKAVSHGKFRMSDINAASLEQIIIMAEQYQFDVYLANSPMYEGLFEHEVFLSYYADVEDTLCQVAQESPRLHYLGLTAVFPANKMENVDHVIDDAAVKYTEMLADLVSQIP